MDGTLTDPPTGLGSEGDELEPGYGLVGAGRAEPFCETPMSLGIGCVRGRRALSELPLVGRGLGAGEDVVGQLGAGAGAAGVVRGVG